MAYTVTVTRTLPRVIPIGRGISILVGKINVTSYNQTLAEITDITTHFQEILQVLIGGIQNVSSEAHLAEWDYTYNSLKVYRIGHAEVSGTLYPSWVEADNDANVGEFYFIAFGKTTGKRGY